MHSDPPFAATSCPFAGLDLRSAAFREDPHAQYQRQREAAPLYWDADLDGWVVLAHAEALAALRHPALTPVQNAPAPGHPAEALLATLADEILLAQPERHTLVRPILAAAFTPEAVESLRPNATRVAEALIARAAPAGRLEVMGQRARPLTFSVACELLGVPPRDRAKVRGWSEAIRRYFLTGQEAPGAVEGHARFHAYVLRLVARRRARPRADMLSRMSAAERPDAALSDGEWVANAMMVLHAGGGNPANLIGNAVRHLILHPSDRAAFARDPGAVLEEVLRHESPVHLAARRAQKDLELGGRRILEGQHVYVMLAAANRDPARFAAPERFDAAREGRGHLAFGQGAHYCLGHGVARMEAEVALEALFSRAEGLELERTEWSATPTLRGPQPLWIRFSPV